LYRRLGGPQGQSGQVWKISPPLAFDPRTIQPIGSHYTDYATRLPISIIKHSYSKDVCVDSVNIHIKTDIFCGKAKPKFGATVSEIIRNRIEKWSNRGNIIFHYNS
jgi:hypothetical protein